MIGRISGHVAWKGDGHVMIDVHGIGYIVYVSERTAAALPPIGQVATLFTDLLVREDLLQLFGFLSLQEKEWHRLLTSVQGIGAKASLAILGTLGPDGVSRAIALGDWAAVKAAPGVGPKLAQRAVNELKGKAAEVMAMGSVAVAEAAEPPQMHEDTRTEPASPARPVAEASNAVSAQADALSALLNLGYAQGEAAAAIAEASGAQDAQDIAVTPDVLIRDALKRLAPKA